MYPDGLLYGRVLRRELELRYSDMQNRLGYRLARDQRGRECRGSSDAPAVLRGRHDRHFRSRALGITVSVCAPVQRSDINSHTTTITATERDACTRADIAADTAADASAYSDAWRADALSRDLTDATADALADHGPRTRAELRPFVRADQHPDVISVVQL